MTYRVTDDQLWKLKEALDQSRDAARNLFRHGPSFAEFGAVWLKLVDFLADLGADLLWARGRIQELTADRDRLLARVNHLEGLWVTSGAVFPAPMSNPPRTVSRET